MNIALANDHAGVDLKNALIEHLKKAGHQTVNFGTDTSDSVDYPDYALKVAQAVAAGSFDRGIIICSTGIGVSVVANKVSGIRAANVTDEIQAARASIDNNANVLCLGAHVVAIPKAMRLVDVYLSSAFANDGRHLRRVNKINALDNKT